MLDPTLLKASIQKLKAKLLKPTQRHSKVSYGGASKIILSRVLNLGSMDDFGGAKRHNILNVCMCTFLGTRSITFIRFLK